MHNAVRDYVRGAATHLFGDFALPPDVLEIGGLDVNGGVRGLVPHSSWHAIDLTAGPGVDEVTDAADWKPPRCWDLVLCLEVLEHAPRWKDIVHTIALATRWGGHAIITAAAPGRPPHRCDGTWWDLRGEYYQNIHPVEIDGLCRDLFVAVATSVLPVTARPVEGGEPGGDVRLTCRR